jgi:hypothetical protein
VQPPPPAPYQPSLSNESLSDDPFVPPPAPPARFTLNITLDPAYASFNCSDCAPPAPPGKADGFHRARDAARAGVPPAPLDRYGSPTLGDCTACGLRLRGVAEQVRECRCCARQLRHASAPACKRSPRRLRPSPQVRGELLAAKKRAALRLLDASTEDGAILFGPAESMAHWVVAACDGDSGVERIADGALRKRQVANLDGP